MLASQRAVRKMPRVTSADFLRTQGEPLRALLRAEYEITGAWHALPGETDANFKVSTNDDDYLVKVSASGAQSSLQLQAAAVEHLATTAPTLPLTRTIANQSGAPLSALEVDDEQRAVWVSRWLPGDLLARQGVVADDVLEQLGQQVGAMAHALTTFEDERADRDLKWDLLQSDWIGDHVDEVEPRTVRDVVTAVHEWFLANHRWLKTLRQSTVHNDVNDHNVLISGSPDRAVTGIVDFGDMCRTAIVAELAIMASYAAMHADDPLAAIDAVTRGFHRELPLEDQELAAIVPLIELRLAVSVTNAAVQAKRRPDDPYVTVSQRDAQRLLCALHGRDHRTATERLRAACGKPPSDTSTQILTHLEAYRDGLPRILATPTPLEEAAVLDLSFDSVTGGDDPTCFDEALASDRIAAQLRDAGVDVALGRYAEPRPIYTDAAFGGPRPNDARRTVHLGIDVFAPAGTAVTTPLPAVVHDVDVCEGHLDYGGLVVLRHEGPDGVIFGTLYGHLDPASIEQLALGQRLEPGDAFAELGDKSVNGGWPPHLHLQLLAADPRGLPDVPRGVADPDDLAAHRLVYPDPSCLLGLRDARAVWQDPHEDLAPTRTQHFATNLKTSYRRPLTLVRGWRHQLFDSYGRRHLDAYNNVPHVGHCHPRVAAAVAEQTAKLATNTRYLHACMQRYAERLRELMPASLEVFFFTPSGSEANELALRLARQHTSRNDVCVMDHGYHGHTTATMELSPYKFRQRGAPPQPEWVHVTKQPDVYRGEHRGGDAGARFGADVAAQLQQVGASGRGLAAYLCECLPSVGGQLELPEGFLPAVYDAARAEGALCIADDVQTGLWRTGTHAFGFERHDVVPDVLVLGKPLGNGFPLGAVVTTRAVADSFARGPEFFSTFGGSTVAMAAGLAVLDVLRDEDLAANARTTGDHLLEGLRSLQGSFELIGDVRGRGLFVGVELVEDRETQAPATAAAAHIKDALRERRVLIGTDGPHDNILKIRPPMTFDRAAADCLLAELERALATARA